ncbi:MAG: mandelate racemase/muconate lactonizing enzyme family protein [Acidimicrobiia bacterium]|nr:mandelate racemase/muconate lactonizing enzyme family protein [Acidimicrobiia bacterium]
MRFTEVETFVVANPPPGYGGKYFVFVKLSTDTGATGWGEVYSPPFEPDTVAALVADVFERSVQGTDPFRIEERTRLLYSLGFTARPDVTIGGIISAFDMASWDIVGKETNRNVTELLGGLVRDRVRSYTYLYPGEGDDGDAVYTDATLAAARAVEYVDAGHTAIKFDPAGPYRAVGPRQPTLNELDRSEAFVNEIREAVGSRADLLFGTHGQFTPSGAIRLGQRLESAAPLWFEEPCPPDIPEAMAEVARHCSVPIAAGERLTSIHEFQRLLVAGVGILQPNLARAGGITAGKKIAAIAEVHGAQLAPHLYSGPIGGAANLAVAATIPNFLILEGIQEWGGFHADILTNPATWEEGHVIPFTEPGLGTEVDEAVARANPWTGGGLHLAMTEDTNDWPG